MAVEGGSLRRRRREPIPVRAVRHRHDVEVDAERMACKELRAHVQRQGLLLEPEGGQHVCSGVARREWELAQTNCRERLEHRRKRRKLGPRCEPGPVQSSGDR